MATFDKHSLCPDIRDLFEIAVGRIDPDLLPLDSGDRDKANIDDYMIPDAEIPGVDEETREEICRVLSDLVSAVGEKTLSAPGGSVTEEELYIYCSDTGLFVGGDSMGRLTQAIFDVYGIEPLTDEEAVEVAKGLNIAEAGGFDLATVQGALARFPQRVINVVTGIVRHIKFKGSKGIALRGDIEVFDTENGYFWADARDARDGMSESQLAQGELAETLSEGGDLYQACVGLADAYAKYVEMDEKDIADSDGTDDAEYAEMVEEIRSRAEEVASAFKQACGVFAAGAGDKMSRLNTFSEKMGSHADKVVESAKTLSSDLGQDEASE